MAFVKHFGNLYGDNTVGPNVSNRTHLTRCVTIKGPLWAWSCFVFGFFNEEIKKAILGTGNACRQIFLSLYNNQKMVESLTIQ